MIKTKDGYGKLVGTAYKGSATDLLLSNGGIKAVSDFSPKDHEHAYLPLTGGTLTGPIEFNTGTLNNQYNEGVRITAAANNWAGITFGSTGLAGAPTNGWFAAKNPSGQFIITPGDSSNTTGLTLTKNGNALWRNNIIYHAGNLTALKNPNELTIFKNTYDGSAAVTVDTVSADVLTQGYLNIHPENSAIIIPFIHNDLAFLNKKGGSYKIYKTTSTTFTSNTLTEVNTSISGGDNMLDGSPSYTMLTESGDFTAVIDLSLHKLFQYSNVFYIDFGSSGWRAKNISVYVKNADNETNYTSKGSVTNQTKGNWYYSISHSSTSGGTTVQGFNRLRIVLSGFATTNSTSGKRIAQVGLINYGSEGVKETFISRGGCNGIYGSLLPQSNNSLDLGSSSKKWANVYATNFVGKASSATNDADGNPIKTTYLRKVTVANNIENDFNLFENMTLTGRGDPTTGASLKNAPWTGGGPAGGYGVLTYLWSGYGTQMAWGYNSNKIYIRNKYYKETSAAWKETWDSIALTSEIPTKVSQLTNDAGYLTSLPSHDHNSAYMRVIEQNSTFTIDAIPNNLAPGVHKIHISGKEYSSILCGNDYTGAQWQLYFHPHASYDQAIKYRYRDGAWRTLLDSTNSSVSKEGQTLTVKINGTEHSLTNTHPPITDSYSGTATDTSLSQKGAKALYDALVNGYASTAGALKNTSISDPNTAADGQNVKWYSQVSQTSGYAGKNYGFPCSNNANGILWLGTHSGPYGWQLGFSSNSRLYARYISNNSFSESANGGSWSRIAWTSDIPTKTSQLTNDSNFITINHTHDAYLPKTTYEYNKELALGSAHTGKVCIGKFPMYDSNIVVDVSTTTNKSFHGTLVIATQNINTSGGGTHNCVVYGDATNEFTSSIRIKYVSGSNVFSIYCNFPQWSKSLIHIKAMALAGTPTDIVTAISDIPADATIIPTNALSTNYAAKSHTHTKADITDFSHNHDAAYLKKSGDQLNTGATLKFDSYGSRFLTISGNSIDADMSADKGTWAGAFATVKSTKETTTMLGWYGSASGGLTHIFMGGSYDDPAMKMTPAGVFTFKNTIQGNISGSAGSVAWSNVSGRPTQLSQFTYNLPVKMINDPGQAVLKASHGLNTNYGTGSYGHPTDEYLQAFLHYLQTNAAGYTCIGTIGPNSQGAYICHVYSSGFNSETKLPEHATGHFFQHGGSHQSFGTSYGVWYNRYFLDASSTSVTDGVGKINGVTITNVQKDSEGNVIKDTYLKRSGGTMNGSITLNQTSTNRRVGLVGSYDPNKAAAIWSMGESYQIATDGSNFGTLYGAAYAYYGTGYTFGAGKANGHSFLWCQAGTPTVALGNNVWTSGGFVKSDSSNDYVLLGGGGHKAVSDFATSGHDHNGTYLPLSGGTMTGAITMNTGTGIAMKYTSGGNDVWMYPNGAPTYGIRYFEGNPDKMAFSATSNNDDITKADLCINGAGDGTVTIRGKKIYKEGDGKLVSGTNFNSGDQNNSFQDCNEMTSNGHWYYSSNGPTKALGATTNDGALYSQAYSTSWVAQIAQDYRNGNLFTRGRNSGTWTAWRKVAYTGEAQPASDVYDWAKAASKPSYAFNEITAGNATIGDGKNQIYLRTDANWMSAIYHNTHADEAVVFLNKGKDVNSIANYTTSWIFAYGTPSERPNWNTLTPALQIKGACVAINKLIGSKVGGSYNLDVNGTANATTLYENGTRVLTQEVDTLTTVTTRGNSTTNAISVGGVTSTGAVCATGGGTGSTAISYTNAAMTIGTMSRAGTAGEYYPGIAFNHMYGYNGGTTYRNHAHAWIGLKLHSTPSAELSYLVFATNGNTTNGTSPVERMSIAPNGDVSILNNLVVSGAVNVGGMICSETELAGPVITSDVVNTTTISASTINATTVNATSGFFQTSDEALKKVIRPITVDLDKLTKLRKVYFKWNDQTEKRELQLGMIAQDVQKLYPELVNTDGGHLSLAYDKLSVIALKAIDELYVLIKDLQKENQELKQKLNSINN